MVEIRQLLQPPPPPLIFIARGNGGLSSQCWNPEMCSLAWDWDCLLPTWIIPPNFYLPHVNVGLSISLPSPPLCTSLHSLCPGSSTLPLLPVRMNAASLNSWLSDFHTARFSDGSGHYLFLRSGCNSFYGCGRRGSISTYAPILTGSLTDFFTCFFYLLLIEIC